MEDKIREEAGFKFIESKGGDHVLLLLHGLFGALSNFQGISRRFSQTYNVVIPLLPIMEMPLVKLSLHGLVDYLERFIVFKGYREVNILGNSLGGHIAQLYALEHPGNVNSLILTGSSGLFESSLGSTFPKRGDYNFIKKKTEDTFYDPATATKELIDEVYNTVNNRLKALRIVKTAKSAVRNNLEESIHKLKMPILLVWGKQDKVTPLFVGVKFNEILENSELKMIDECGHAPMMEKPEEFNDILEDFLAKVTSPDKVKV